MEKTLLEAVLCFPITNADVLLARKTRYIGEGCLNGYGGGLEPEDNGDEFSAMIRELEQESGLVVARDNLDKVAVVDFHNQKSDGVEFTCRVHVFLAHSWSGTPRATEEMENPAWYPRTKLPVDHMMLADKLWLPPVLTGKRLYAEVWYGPKQQSLRAPGCTIREVTVEELRGFRPAA